MVFAKCLASDQLAYTGTAFHLHHIRALLDLFEPLYLKMCLLDMLLMKAHISLDAIHMVH